MKYTYFPCVDIEINIYNFLSEIDTGVLLCRLVDCIRKKLFTEAKGKANKVRGRVNVCYEGLGFRFREGEGRKEV